MNDINHMTELIHENSVKHGWWENDRELPEIIALCHSEWKKHKYNVTRPYKHGGKRI